MNDKGAITCVKCKQKIRIPPNMDTSTGQPRFLVPVTCPNCQEVFVWFNFPALSSNTPEEILQILKPMVKETPCDPTIHYNIGLAYSKLDRYEEAIESYKRAIDCNTEIPEVYLYLGIAYGQLEKYKDSINALDKAKQLIPNDQRIISSLAIQYCKSGNPKKGIAVFKDALKINPNNIMVLGCLGDAYYEIGNHEEAVKAYKQIVEIEPQNATAHYNLSVSYISLNNYESAMEEYEILKNLDEDLAKNLIDSIKLSPEEIGLELSRRLKESIESIPGSLSIIKNEGKGIFSLKDIDKKNLIRELTILTYVGQRLAIQLMQKKGSERDENKRKQICNSLDNYSSQFLENSPESYDLLDRRGEQYFQLIQSHNEEISNGNWKNFFEALQFKFEQFCRGGGGENEPVIIGNFSSMVPLRGLTIQYWSNGFTETVKFLKTQEPL